MQVSDVVLGLLTFPIPLSLLWSRSGNFDKCCKLLPWIEFKWRKSGEELVYIRCEWTSLSYFKNQIEGWFVLRASSLFNDSYSYLLSSISLLTYFGLKCIIIQRFFGSNESVGKVEFQLGIHQTVHYAPKASNTVLPQIYAGWRRNAVEGLVFSTFEWWEEVEKNEDKKRRKDICGKLLLPDLTWSGLQAYRAGLKLLNSSQFLSGVWTPLNISTDNISGRLWWPN